MLVVSAYADPSGKGEENFPRQQLCQCWIDYLCSLWKHSGVGYWQRIIGNICSFSTCPCNPSCVIMPLVLCMLLQSSYGNAFSCVYMCTCIPKLLSPQSSVPRVSLEQNKFGNSCCRTYICRENWALLIKSLSCPVLVQRFSPVSQGSVSRQLQQFQREECPEGRALSGELSHSWEAHADAAELAFFAEDVCLEGRNYSKMCLFIISSFCHIPLILPCLAAMPVVEVLPKIPLYNPFFIS